MATGTIADAIPLPMQHAAFDVTQPAAARRHFLHSLKWWPDTPGSWALGWTLIEVVGAQFFVVTGDPRLMATTAAEPPAAIDLASVAALRVTDEGDVEWVISRSINPRSGIVPRRGGQ